MNTLRGILVGFGTMGQLHAGRYAQLGAVVQTVVEPDPERGELARSLGMTVVKGLKNIPADTRAFC